MCLSGKFREVIALIPSGSTLNNRLQLKAQYTIIRDHFSCVRAITRYEAITIYQAFQDVRFGDINWTALHNTGSTFTDKIKKDDLILEITKEGVFFHNVANQVSVTCYK